MPQLCYLNCKLNKDKQWQNFPVHQNNFVQTINIPVLHHGTTKIANATELQINNKDKCMYS